MEHEDEEFQQLLEEIPQVMNHAHAAIDKSEATPPTQDVAPSLSRDVFPDLFQVFNPVKELGRGEEDCSCPLPSRFHPPHQAYMHQKGPLTCHGFTRTHSRDVPFDSSVDSSLATALTNLNLKGAEAEQSLLHSRESGDGSEAGATWPGSLNKFHTAGGGSTASLTPQLAQDNLDSELPCYRSVCFDDADGLLSGRLSHPHVNAVSNDRVMSLSDCNVSGNTSHSIGGGPDYGTHLQQGLEPRPRPLLSSNYQDVLLSPNMANRKEVWEGDIAMASYLQGQVLPTAQLMRELMEGRRLKFEQGHAGGLPNMTSESFHGGRVPSYLLPTGGATHGPVAADPRLYAEQHLRYGSNELNSPQPEALDAYLFLQGLCNGMSSPSFYAKQRDFTWNKDLQLHLSSPFVDTLHSTGGLHENHVSSPVKILSRKSSRVAAPQLNPLLGLLDRSQYQACFRQSAALDNGGPLGSNGLTRPHMDFLRYNPLDTLQSPPIYSSLAEIEGHIPSVAKDQHGCRFLQKKFDEGTIEDTKKIFSEIIDHAVELMVDPFGNYLMQKLLEVCTDEQRMDLLKVMTSNGELIHVSLNMHGTRAVQKLVETLGSREQVSVFTTSLRPGVVSLIKDLNGNHVIQRCLQHLTSEDNEFIFEAAACHCVEIATHRHGCCVLQRCVDHSTGMSRQRLIIEIAANSLLLAQDPFGNYVVQYILDLDLAWATEKVLNHLTDNYAHLSVQKFSSNVVEKCLKLANEDGRALIIQELMDSSLLPQLLQDPYANYVIQSALMASKGALHSCLVEAIRPHVPSLRSNPYGKRILSRRSFKKL